MRGAVAAITAAAAAAAAATHAILGGWAPANCLLGPVELADRLPFGLLLQWEDYFAPIADAKGEELSGNQLFRWLQEIGTYPAPVSRTEL